MKKSIVLLLALALFMIPSVAFADTTEVTMVFEPQAETSAMDKITEQILKVKNVEMEKEFKENHPELYEAFKRTMDTPYGFNMNMNVIATIDFADQEMAQLLGFRRVLAKAYVNGYINLPAEAIEMRMNMDVDAGQVMKESIEGIAFILKNDQMYTFDPTFEKWTVDNIDSSDVFKVTGNPMEQSQLGYFGPIADMMKKRQTVDSSIYSVNLTGEDIKTMVDEYAGIPIYDDLITEMSASGVTFEIPKVEMIYVIKDGVIRAQHIEMKISVITEEATINMSFALDGEYYSYGLQKEIVTPEIPEVPES